MNTRVRLSRTFWPATWVFSVCTAALLAAGPVQARGCDRDCLVSRTNAYLSALAAHSPTAAFLGAHILFVENTVRMHPGEGLWKTASRGAHGMSLYVPDPVKQSAGWMGMMEESGKPVFVAIKLQLQGGRITAAEHLIVRGLDEKRLAVLHGPARPGLVTAVLPSERLPREKLVAIGASYYDALDENNGSLAPFAKDCERQDNGAIAVGPNVHGWPEPDYPHIDMTCGGQLDSQVMSYIDTIDDRRVFAADPVYGLAMGMSHFHHKMDNKSVEVRLPDGSKGVRRMSEGPYDSVNAHIWKIGPEGQIHEIEALGIKAPYMCPTGRE